MVRRKGEKHEDREKKIGAWDVAIAFERPVVLVHGDSHSFRIDKPMIGTRSRRRVENFTRVETFGENDNHWLHVTVEPTSPNVFLFDQRIVAANLIAQ